MPRTLVRAVVALAALVAVAAHAEEGADKWADHKGNLPFVVGYAAGLEQVELTGRPPMYFFTTTW